MKIVLLLLLVSSAAHASSRSQFIEAAVKQCGKSKEEATKLATPGRSGNVVKLKLCPHNPVKITADCRLNCLDKGNIVGN